MQATAIAVRNVEFAIATANAGANALFTVTKAGAKNPKHASFAYLIANGAKDARESVAETLREQWVANGQYRPLFRDFVASGLIPKTAQPYVAAIVPDAGPINKDAFIRLCRTIEGIYSAKAAEGKAAKGTKSQQLEIVRKFAAMSTSDDDSRTLEA